MKLIKLPEHCHNMVSLLGVVLFLALATVTSTGQRGYFSFYLIIFCTFYALIQLSVVERWQKMRGKTDGEWRAVTWHCSSWSVPRPQSHQGAPSVFFKHWLEMQMNHLSENIKNQTCAVADFHYEVSDRKTLSCGGVINTEKKSLKSVLQQTDRKCNLVHGWGVSPERTHSSLVPWSQNSWTWARPRDRNFSTMDCSLAVLALSSSRISLLT